MRELIVADDGVAVVARFARAAEAAKHVVGVHRAIQHAPRVLVSGAPLRKDRHPRIHDLDDVIGADRERIVGRIPQGRRALRPLETDAQAVELRGERRRRPRSFGRLFDILRQQESR